MLAGDAVVQVLRAVWVADGYPWPLRLKALLPSWLPWARQRFAVTPGTDTKLRAISARQMDRLLAPDTRTIRRLYGRTTPGTLLTHHIPITTDKDRERTEKPRRGAVTSAPLRRPSVYQPTLIWNWMERA